MEIVGNRSFTLTTANGKWCPTGIRLGTLQYLHLWPAKHRLQNAYTRRRLCSHASWRTMTSSGRGAIQIHGNCRWIPPDMEVKSQYYKGSLGSLRSQQQEAKRELKVNHNNETLLFCYEPKCFGVTLDRTLTYCQHLESLREKLTSRIALLRRLAGSGWGAVAPTLRSATLALVHSTAEYCATDWCRSAHTCLIDCHQRRLATCDWMPASYTSRQSSHRRRHPTCRASLQRAPCLARGSMEPGHLLHTALACPSSWNARISNRDTHLYPLHNSSIHLPTMTEVRCTRRNNHLSTGHFRSC